MQLQRRDFDDLCFDAITPFSGGLALVRQGAQHFVLHPDGSRTPALPCEAQSSFSADLIPCKAQEGWGYIAGDGQWFRSPRWISAGGFREGWAPVKDDSGLALLSLEGGVLRLPHLSRLREVHEGKAAAARILEDGEFWGFIDTLGHWVIPPQFQAVAEGFSEGFAWVSGSAAGENRAGFVDAKGAWMPGSEHAWLADFREGLAAFGDGRFVGKRFQGRFGVMDQNGIPRIAAEFEAVGPFRQGLAPAWREGRSSLIDTTGKARVMARKGEAILEGPENGYYPVKGEAGWEFRPLDGRRKQLGPFFDVEGFREGWAGIRTPEGCWGFIDTTGKPLTPASAEIRTARD